jgi:hypothetical protein
VRVAAAWPVSGHAVFRARGRRQAGRLQAFQPRPASSRRGARRVERPSRGANTVIQAVLKPGRSNDLAAPDTSFDNHRMIRKYPDL